MDGFIERGAGGEGYSECWLKPTPLRARRRRHDGLSEGTLHVEDATIAQQVVAGACELVCHGLDGDDLVTLAALTDAKPGSE